MNWSFEDLMMVIDDRENMTKDKLKFTLYEAKQHLIKMNKELSALRPIRHGIKMLIEEYRE